jgi:hypothetical protein
VDKCAGCQFYDRQTGKQTDSRGVQWGQCRRSAPMLHPINQKSYMIEGVWPHVRDDDWCGEWKSSGRRTESRLPDSLSSGPLLPALNPSPFAPRPAMTPTSIGGSTFASGPDVGAVAASGRGD